MPRGALVGVEGWEELSVERIDNRNDQPADGKLLACSSSILIIMGSPSHNTWAVKDTCWAGKFLQVEDKFVGLTSVTSFIFSINLHGFQRTEHSWYAVVR